jgi:predicted ABC-type ATPase
MNAHKPDRSLLARNCYTRAMARKRQKPRCIVIAGPNGAGKTTFARDYLPAIAGLIHFINVDLIAGGISPLRPELAAVTAGRLVLRELDRLVDAKADFAFESTLSGIRYANRIQNWKAQGYSIEIVYIRLPSPQLALSRVAARVKQGGHSVARADVLRRYKRGWINFIEVYQPLADHWAIYDNSELTPQLRERGP